MIRNVDFLLIITGEKDVLILKPNPDNPKSRAMEISVRL